MNEGEGGNCFKIITNHNSNFALFYILKNCSKVVHLNH